MPYLKGAIKEGLRLHPPAIGTVRVIEGPFELNGFRMEKPCLYFAVNAVMQTSSRYIKVRILFNFGGFNKTYLIILTYINITIT